ncbi:TRMT2A (predicted) [Pycnogonum litorale]
MDQVTYSESVMDCDSNKDESDPYLYTKRKEFTSEIFKIEIGNIPLHTGFAEVKKLLTRRLKLKPNKIKVLSAKRSQYAFVNFRCEEDRCEAIKLISSFKYKGHELKAKNANPVADPYIQKRKFHGEDLNETKKTKCNDDDDVPIDTRLKNAVIPLWNIPYDEQLVQKENDIKKFLSKLGYEIEKVNPGLRSRINSQRKSYNGSCCKFNGVKSSPVINGYRNKCEFTIGYGSDEGSERSRTIGFRLSSYSAGSMMVCQPDECLNLDSLMKTVVKHFQDYVRASDKAPFCQNTHDGYWRQLTVRTTTKNDVMAVVVMHPQTLTEEELDKEKEKLTEYFFEGPGKTCGLTSLYLQLFSKRKSGEDPPLYYLKGEKFIQEALHDLKFNISPDAFFQVNTPAAEVLYSSIGDLVKLSPDTTLLDVCCGTGTIGLCLSKKVGKVIGVELNESAIGDAKQNARINGIENADFICGKAEDTIYGVIKRAPTDDIVTIVDPPRAGLHSRVIKVIRANRLLKKLVYVSCNPNAAKNNFLELCRTTSNNYKGEPFVPVEATAVDLFPHTPHCELVVLFERANDDRKPEKQEQD